MLDGWYCRSMANIQAGGESGGGEEDGNGSHLQQPPNQHRGYSSESSREVTPEPNYKAQYLALKKKLKYLIYENECFQDALRSSQKRLLKVSRDRSYLLDRLLQHEKPDSSTSESEDTESSDDMDFRRMETLKRRKADAAANQHNLSQASPVHKPSNAVKRKRPPAKRNTNSGHQPYSSKISPAMAFNLSNAGDGHMTPEEVERHLQSRQSYLELLPERAPPTVPTEMFSNDPSLDSESNDVMENSPNVDEWFD